MRRDMAKKENGMKQQRNEAVQMPVETLQQMLQGLRYGTLELTVHDGRVVQIERREKLRLG